MHLFNFLFKKKQITYLGRGGIKYFDGKNEFYIDTNTIFGKKLSVEILRNEIKHSDHTPLADLEKKKIALAVEEILKKRKVDVMITPPLTIDFIMENSSNK